MTSFPSTCLLRRPKQPGGHRGQDEDERRLNNVKALESRFDTLYGSNLGNRVVAGRRFSDTTSEQSHVTDIGLDQIRKKTEFRLTTSKNDDQAGESHPQV